MAHAGSLESGRDAVARQAWGDAYRDLSAADAADATRRRRPRAAGAQRPHDRPHRRGGPGLGAGLPRRDRWRPAGPRRASCLPHHHGPRPAGRVRAGRRLARSRHRGPRRGGSRRRRARLPAHPRGAPGARERRRGDRASGCSSGWPSWPGASATAISPPLAGWVAASRSSRWARWLAGWPSSTRRCWRSRPARWRRSRSGPCTAPRSRRSARSSTSVARRSGPPRSAPGATPSPTSSRSVAGASSTGPRSWSSTACGATPIARPSAREAWLSRPPIEPAVGEAHYRRAELHRLRGKHAEAEQEYRKASQWGRRPDPGLALLRLAAGDGIGCRRLDPASARRDRRAWPAPGCSRRSSRSCSPPATWRPPARRRPSSPRWPTDRVPRCCWRSRHEPRARCAWPKATRARRSPRCARRRPAGRSSTPRTSPRGSGSGSAGPAWSWATRDAAELEFDAARRAFAALGAAPDLGRLDRLAGEAAADRPGGLTGREIEILRLLATGRTNRVDRRGPDDQRTDRGPPREQHLHEARREHARRRDRLGLRARPRLTASRYPCRRRARLGSRADAVRASPLVRWPWRPGDTPVASDTGQLEGDTNGRQARTRADRHDRHRGRTGRAVGRLPPRQARRAVRHPRCRRAHRRPLAEAAGTRSGCTARPATTRCPGMRFPASTSH